MTAPRKTILIVEDEPHLMAVLRALIQYSEFKVIQASDGQEAVEKLREGLPDAIVLDIKMPRLDGWGVLTHLQSDPAMSAVPVIVYSTIADPKDVQRGLSLGARTYISKEKDVIEVVAALKKIFGQNA
ncbi:MAG: hypothetical protein A2636_05510 [Elusimicrobia bacterium RIFCSPHIGHO2_01_FULL_64_10]|nr:MAG: hypothetical protein A2636_05510 [Elusimicrobia bacterium RIFCSPHIGHO2_01_FULL_64_10]